MTSGNVYRTTARVGPGHRIEILAPELAEGEEIEVLLMQQKGGSRSSDSSIIDFLLSEERPVRDAPYWEERERELKESRDSWDR